jgi:hypothetical protein
MQPMGDFWMFVEPTGRRIVFDIIYSIIIEHFMYN